MLVKVFLLLIFCTLVYTNVDRQKVRDIYEMKYVNSSEYRGIWFPSEYSVDLGRFISGYKIRVEAMGRLEKVPYYYMTYVQK